MHSTLKDNYKKYLFESLGILAIFLIWLFASILINNDIVLPSIGLVFKSLFNLLKKGETYLIILYTLLRIIISLIIGIFFGILLGVLSSQIKAIHYFISPIIKIMRALPIASIILIILIMFGQNGFGDLTFSPILVTTLLIIPIVYEAVYKGIINIDESLVYVARLYSTSKFNMITKSFLPLIKNEISISLAQSIGLSFKAMVMAEYISQTQTSIGFALLNAKSWLEYQDVFAWTIILIVLAMIIEALSAYIVKKNWVILDKVLI